MADDLETTAAAAPMASARPISVPGSLTLAEDHPAAMIRIAGAGDLSLDELSATLHPLWLGPEERLIVAERTPAEEVVRELHGLCTSAVLIADASQGWRRFRVEGVEAAALLASGTALDLASSTTPVGWSAPTGYREIGVLLHAAGPERFDLYVPRSFARCLWEWLTDAAAGSGMELEHEPPRASTG